MPAPAGIVIPRRVQLNYDRLCAAVQDATQGHVNNLTQQQALAEIRGLRATIAAPLDPATQRPPSPEDRARISGQGEVRIHLHDNDIVTAPDDPATVVVLGADLVSVAIALSDELHLNELHSGVLLSEARTRASHRADHDVVAAAKELFALQRRQALLYLQEIVRSGLLASTHASSANEGSFLSSLMRERDLLVVEHSVFSNLLTRLDAGLRAAASQSPPNPSVGLFQKGDLVLLAETIFLLAYTVQLTRSDALALRALLTLAVDVHDGVMNRERASQRSGSRPFAAAQTPGMPGADGASAAAASAASQEADVPSPPLVEVESVRNLLLLAWFSALDRSRYHDVYDPRTARQGVNHLLKDPSFINSTNNVPPQQDDGDDDAVRALSPTIAAAELCAAVFRLAVAEPDEQEAVTTFLRVSAYGNALAFLSTNITTWIRERAGSLSSDADLYADVLEDLAHDIAEAPHILGPVLQFSHQAVQDAAVVAAYSNPPDGLPGGFNSAGPSGFPSTPGFGTGSARRSRPLSTGPSMTPTSGRRSSLGNSSLRGRPPRPPSHRASMQLPPSSESGRLSDATPFAQDFPAVRPKEEDVKPSLPSSDNLLASLSFFVARAISLAPGKLNNESLGGGLRYWVSIGPGNMGFIPRIGDAVVDQWDASMRNAYSPGGVGEAFRRGLEGFLELLASTSKKQASPAHAIAVLRYLSEGGHPVVSLERVVRGMTMMNNRLGTTASSGEAQLDDADVELLSGVANIIANAAETVADHAGIETYLGDAGKDLPNCLGALAIHNVHPRLKQALLRALRAFGQRRSIISHLENVAKDKAAPLRQFFRSYDAQTGEYDVTIEMLRLVSSVTNWDNDFPEGAVESITIWFAIEEVLMFWSRRKYVQEAHRWKIIEAAGNLIRDVVYREPNSQRSFRILARLLTPAPGTGASSFALRSLVCAAGLMRAGDELEPSSAIRSYDHFTASLYRISGKESLIFAAEHGLGDAYRAMQEAIQTSSRVLSMLLYVPSGRITVPGAVVVSASELLLGELKALSSAASLVFAADGFCPELSRAGYSLSVCGAVLAMLSKAAHESTNIAAIFAKDPAGGNTSAKQFRSSLAGIISQSVADVTGKADEKKPEEEDQTEEEKKKHEEERAKMYSIASKSFPDPPIMHSALRIVEACLGSDGGSAPGMFLLGLQMDTSNRYIKAEHGVLGALIELVANSFRDDDSSNIRSCATAATFLERLAANTVRTTSNIVLEHIRDLCRSDSNVRGAGFADEIVFRLLDSFRDFDPLNVSEHIEWNALAEVLSANLSLSALQVRMFPDYERERCASKSTSGAGRYDDLVYNGSVHEPPSPLELLRLLQTMATFGDPQIVFEGFRTWYHLFGTRLEVHERNSGYANIPLLFEITTMLLDALAQTGSEQSLAGLVKRDHGEIAAASVLICVQKLRECDNASESGAQQSIADAQCGTILSGIVRAMAEVGRIGTSSSRARTSLYVAFLICGSMSENRVSEEAITRALGGRVGQRQQSGTDVMLDSACNDAISGPTGAAKCAAMAVASLIATMDPPRAMNALGSQNRLRRIMQNALAEPEKQALIAVACSWSPGEDRKHGNDAPNRSAVVVAEAAIALIHAVAASGHGARVITESGCIDSLVSLFTALPSRSMSDYRSGIDPDRGFGDFSTGFTGLDLGRESFGFERERLRETAWLGNDGMDVTEGSGDDEFLEQRVSMVANITGALAAAVSCSSGMFDSSSIVALGEGKEVFTELLRNVRLAGWHELETIGSLGIIMTRLTDDVMMGRDGGSKLGGWLAGVIGSIVPAESSVHHLGASRSHLSAGVSMMEPETARDARRMRVMHPEGGSLFERSLVKARSICLRNMFAALRQPQRILSLFAPTLGAKHEGLAGSVRDSGARGRLTDVVRVCRTMLREIEWAADESMRIESRLASETGSSVGSQRVSELADFCHEEYGAERAGLSGAAAMGYLKKTAAAAREHAERCVTVFESGVFILREYLRVARETVRGRRAPQLAVGEGGMVSVLEGEVDGVAEMSVAQAEELLDQAQKVLVPVCLDVEGLGEGVWVGKDTSFSKQICRQIRTCCSGRN